MQNNENDPVAKSPLSAGISRRSFHRGFVTAGIAFAAGGPSSGCDTPTEFDFIVVGAGPGGGPIAARLAEAGYTVALVEAGIDSQGAEAAALDPSVSTIYKLPAFFAVAAEHPLLSWDFFVNHYTDVNQQMRDPKYVAGKGILYPRGSALGGSAAHNALFFVYPHDADFDDIARITGDPTWKSTHMRRYFERVENCEYCQPAEPGHGFKGYFPSNLFDEKVFELYPQLKDVALAGAETPSSVARGNTNFDVNHPLVAAGDTGTFRTPMHIHQNKRISIREHLIDTQAAHPDRLFLFTGALATKVITRKGAAVGLEMMIGADLYAADKKFDPTAEGRRVTINARREVILSAGAFNTPQLLKLSGIGPADELQQMGIPVVQDLPGVGSNLQDRYEITTNLELRSPLDLYTRCLPFQPGDPCLDAFNTGVWSGSNGPFFGPYANNAIFASRIAKSSPDKVVPDLFIAGAPLAFKGYVPGFSQGPVGLHWTWLVLKAHTKNTAGTVTLRSANPRDMPLINFRYFEEGNDGGGEDLQAVVNGLKTLRRLAGLPDAAQHLGTELLPGSQVQTDDQLRQFARDQAWGHHASCTAKIGAKDDRMAVLDSRFRVRGVKRLRVVDASSFPRTPGFYPVAAILMISEKAADAVLEETL